MSELAQSLLQQRQRQRDRLRARIHGETLIDQAICVRDYLLSGIAPVLAPPGQGQGPLEGELVGWEPLDRTRATQLKDAASITLSLLNKVLPDERAIDLQIDDVSKPKPGLSDLQLAARLAYMVGMLPDTPPALPAIEVSPSVGAAAQEPEWL